MLERRPNGQSDSVFWRQNENTIPESYCLHWRRNRMALDLKSTLDQIAASCWCSRFLLTLSLNRKV